MKKKILTRLGLAVTLSVACLPAQAVVIGLAEYAFNMDGFVSDMTYGDPVPAGVDLSGFDETTGLGTLRFTFCLGKTEFFRGSLMTGTVNTPRPESRFPASFSPVPLRLNRLTGFEQVVDPIKRIGSGNGAGGAGNHCGENR